MQEFAQAARVLLGESYWQTAQHHQWLAALSAALEATTTEVRNSQTGHHNNQQQNWFWE